MKLDQVPQRELNPKKYREYLIETERLAGIGLLAAGVAHELSNPINVITATCNNLLAQLAEGRLDQDGIRHYVEVIDQSAWRCARLTQALREYSYLNGQSFELSDLNQIIEGALALTRYDFERQHRLVFHLELAQELPPILCDPHQITQVIINLLTNARDALQPGGGHIIVRTWHNQEQQSVGLSVGDRGCGIDPKIQERMFEPFATTKAPGEGTGLGLAVCAQIISAHKGRIKGENNPAGGATFTVELPA